MRKLEEINLNTAHGPSPITGKITKTPKAETKWDMPHNAYRVKIGYEGRELVVDWREGLGITPGETKLSDVLQAVSSDAQSGIEYRGDLLGFVNDFGYELGDRKSRKAVTKTWEACVKLGDDLSALFGEDFDTFTEWAGEL